MTDGLIALLPLKAHSERVPRKNFRTFCGKPLFQWMLDTLLEVAEIDRVVINTDARELLEQHGLRESQRVLVRDRPVELQGDFVSMNRIIENDLQAVPSELYLMTHVTNPLLSAVTIRSAMKTFRETRDRDGIDSLFTVNSFQSRFYWQDGRPVNHDPTRLVRTQDLPPLYEENSNLYLFTRESFGATGARIGAKPATFVTPRLESWDIDDEEGWMVAELVAARALHA